MARNGVLPHKNVMAFPLEKLRARFPGRAIEFHESIDSTMMRAAELGAGGQSSGATVIAGEQTGGLGRHGHAWHSEPGKGLYASVVLRLPVASGTLPSLTLALGLATGEAIAQSTGLGVDLRWPNDVMIGDRKVAGILVQLYDSYAVAGIGINVNHASFPGGLAEEATSLRLAAGREFALEEIAAALLACVDRFAKMLVQGGKQPIHAMFCRASSYARGKRVRVKQAGGDVEGVTDGLDESGFLTVKQSDGTRSVILAGGVRPA